MNRDGCCQRLEVLHIAAMFLAVSIFVGQGMLSGAVARSGDVAALKRVLSAEDRFAPVGGATYLLGIVFGFVSAITADFDLTQTWLLIGYALSAFILVKDSRTTGRTPRSSRRRPRPGTGTGRVRSRVRRAPS